ncbi:MAG: hypothetical protein IT326_02445 [Anaerolineae bacterium]|nr:hypothetical protein [Anaerolineae bacterium]
MNARYQSILSSGWWLPVLLALAVIVLAGCGGSGVTSADLFVPNAGDFLRVSGPATEADTGVDVALYQGPQGDVTLRIRQLSQGQIDYALSVLPQNATEVGYDPALGQRNGTCFTFANEYHASWGNGDWIFVLTASSPEARAAFLAAYGF